MPELIPGAVVVIAKVPRPGRVKTRLSPPLTAEQACEVAWACLTDTLAAAAAVPSRRHVLLLDGEAGPWTPPDFEVIGQRGEGLGDRLAAGFADVADDAVVIAMDTPQVGGERLAVALGALQRGYDSVLGPATDGGYWLIGLRAAVEAGSVFDGVPMSTSGTGAAQHERLRHLGLSTLVLDELQDVDTIDDVWTVGAAHRPSRLGRLTESWRTRR